jgi:hypothetical protein
MPLGLIPLEVIWEALALADLVIKINSLQGAERFEYRPGHRLSWKRFFVVFLSPTQTNAGIVPQLSRDRFLPNPLQFVIYQVILSFDAV